MAEGDAYANVASGGDIAGDAGDFIKSRTRLPALHLPNRVALARKRALARGTSTHLIVTATRDPAQAPILTTATTPAAAATSSAQFASLAVFGDGRFVGLYGVVDVVPGLRMTATSAVTSTSVPASWSPLDVDLRSLYGEVQLTYNGLAGCQLDLQAHQAREGRMFTFTAFTNPMALSRRLGSAVTPSLGRVLERFQFEEHLALFQGSNYSAASFGFGLRYTHPLAPAQSDDDGPAPKLLVEAKWQTLAGILGLVVVYDPVDVLHAADDFRGGDQGQQGQQGHQGARTGLCAIGRLSHQRTTRASQVLLGLRYYGNGFRVGGNSELEAVPGSSKWSTSVSWMQRFKHTDVGAYASFVVAGQVAQPPTFGVSLNYRL